MKMITKLRAKFIIVTMAVLIIVFSIVFISINISMNQESMQRTEFVLEMIVENDGAPVPPVMDKSAEGLLYGGPKRPPALPEQPVKGEVHSGRYFYAKTDYEYDITEIYTDLMYDFNEETLRSYIETAIKGGKTRGSLQGFEYLTAKKGYGYIIVFAERSVEIGMLGCLMTISLWAAGISCVVLFLFVFFLSKWMVKPVKETLEKQQRFISDASHELKTPLTIISTNADVLENEIGSNARIESIRAQSKRMNNLVKDLLTLARTDENAERPVFARFNLSAAILNSTLEFESYAFENQKLLSYDIDESIEYNGDERKIKQLLGILLDNAVKYSSKGASISVKLKGYGGHPRLSVFNSDSSISKEGTEHIFDRFYREDTSRSRKTGGYGLGLSIAKSIVDVHKGRIQAKTENGVTLEVKL